jgi:hypothetical protein
MSEPSATPEADFWHVQLLSGEVRYWSLEELDEAFQRDEVDAKTYVLKEGETTWQRLGELLGLDEVAPDVVAVPVAPYSISSTVPPSIAPPSSEAPGALSIRPVVSDLDDDEVMAAMKPKRKNVAAIAGGVAVAALVLIGAVTHAASGGDDKATAAAAAPPPVAVSAPPVTTDEAAAAAHSTLSDDQKRALLEADKVREAKAAAKAAERAAENAKYRTNTSTYRTPKSGQVFHKGGNKYDPLNAGN